MVNETLLTLAADIISAHVGHNKVAAEELPQLIAAVYGSLENLGQPAAPVEEERKPAVSVRASIKPDAITCLECGTKLKMLKRHLTTHHQMTPAEYRSRWNLTADYPLVAPNYADTRKELAQRIGLGRKPRGKATTAGGSTQPITEPAVTPAPKAPAKSGPETDIETGPKSAKPRSRPKLGIAAGEA
jgi:predicted transcriptional regulator